MSWLFLFLLVLFQTFLVLTELRKSPNANKIWATCSVTSTKLFSLTMITFFSRVDTANTCKTPIFNPNFWSYSTLPLKSRLLSELRWLLNKTTLLVRSHFCLWWLTFCSSICTRDYTELFLALCPCLTIGWLASKFECLWQILKQLYWSWTYFRNGMNRFYVLSSLSLCSEWCVFLQITYKRILYIVLGNCFGTEIVITFYSPNCLG